MNRPSTSLGRCDATHPPRGLASGHIWLALLPFLIATVQCGGDDASAMGDAGGAGGGTNPDGGGSGATAGSGGGPGGAGGSGATSGSGGVGGSAGAAGMGGGVLAPPPEPTLYVVHASPDLYDFRVCLSADGAVLDEMPMPYDPAFPVPYTNHTGVPVGGAAELTSILPMLTDKTEFTVHVIDASNDKVSGVYEGSSTEVSCKDLICGMTSCLGANEVTTFGPFPVGAFDAEPVQLLVVEGCLTNTGLNIPLDQDNCGPSFDPATPASTLDVRAVGVFPEFNTSDLGVTVYAGRVAPTLDATYAGKALRLSFGTLANVDELDPLVQDLRGVPAPSDLSPVPMPIAEEDYRTTGLVLDAVDPGGDVEQVLSASLADVLALQEPDALATNFYSSASGYLFVVLGEAAPAAEPWLFAPNDANPAYDGRGLHIIALRMRESIP